MILISTLTIGVAVIALVSCSQSSYQSYGDRRQTHSTNSNLNAGSGNKYVSPSYPYGTTLGVGNPSQYGNIYGGSYGGYPGYGGYSGYGGYPGGIGYPYPGGAGGYPFPGYGVYPGVGGIYPGIGTGYPGIGTGYPGIGTGYPGIGTGYPGIGTGYPVIGTGYPGIGTGYPGIGGIYPGLGGSIYPGVGSYPGIGYPTGNPYTNPYFRAK